VEEIPVLYQDIINSKMAAMADRKLHSQMVALGPPDIGFAHGTATSLYNGIILWHGRNKPSNLSFFTLYKNKSLSEAQTSRYLSLNILANNVDNKNSKSVIHLTPGGVSFPVSSPFFLFPYACTKIFNFVAHHHFCSSWFLR
jgi:hypothetical protein